MRLDEAYANAAFIPGGADFPARWAARAAAFRAQAGGRLSLSYGSADRQRLDLFEPKGTAHGTVIFVHGGYWLAFGKEDFSHLATGALARGWRVAMPSYTLCPQVRISAITAEIAAAVTFVSRQCPGPLRLAGHSAGAHLVARMACDDTLPDAVAERVAMILPISPLSDLGPLRETTMNEKLRIDAAEAMEESPAFLLNHPEIPVHVWVGAEERPAFLDQARWLAGAWKVPLTVQPGRHHFDMIDGLEDAKSPLMAALLGADQR